MKIMVKISKVAIGCYTPILKRNRTKNPRLFMNIKSLPFFFYIKGIINHASL